MANRLKNLQKHFKSILVLLILEQICTRIVFFLKTDKMDSLAETSNKNVCCKCPKKYLDTLKLTLKWSKNIYQIDNTHF